VPLLVKTETSLPIPKSVWAQINGCETKFLE
jgi:hypothetical protein